jgi:Zn finger protein HypA/HybF involved in hydrogenase expression
MGTEYLAKCNKCGTEFRVREGGGFIFHLLHCDKCGKEKSVKFGELGENHIRFIKGLDIPYSSVSADSDRSIQENYPGSAITQEQYYSEVEKIAGKCSCGGQYYLSAKARCPKCHSDNYMNTGIGTIDYD